MQRVTVDGYIQTGKSKEQVQPFLGVTGFKDFVQGTSCEIILPASGFESATFRSQSLNPQSR